MRKEFLERVMSDGEAFSLPVLDGQALRHMLEDTTLSASVTLLREAKVGMGFFPVVGAGIKAHKDAPN